MEKEDLLTRLRKQYPQLSKRQKQIADYILTDYDRAAFITALKLGRMVGVSESTVVRFAYAMGYDGYPALQKSLQEQLRNKLTAVQRVQLASDMPEEDVLKNVLKADMNNIRSTLENVDNNVFSGAVHALLEAEHVYVIGLRSAMPLMQFLSYYLNFVRGNIISVAGAFSGTTEEMLRIGEKDVCVGISFPRYSTRTVNAMKYARGQGAKTIAITDSESSPLTPLADYVLLARSDMASFADSLVAPLSLINALIVAAGMQCKDALYAHFAKLENIWGQERVYMTPEQENQP